MSNSVNIDELLTAVDQATRPFRTLETASVSLSDGIKETEKNLRNLHSRVAQIDSFTGAQRALSGVSGQLKTAKEQARALATEMKNSDAPTRTQTKALEKARENVSKLSQQHNTLRLSVKNQRQTLQQAGINTRAPATARNRLQGNISENSEQLNAQRQALRLQNRQSRVAKLQKGKETIDAMGAKVSAVGDFSMSIAKTGFDWGKKLLQPGYEQSLKNSAAAVPAGARNGAAGSLSAAVTSSATIALTSAASTLTSATAGSASAVNTLTSAAAGSASTVSTLNGAAADCFSAASTPGDSDSAESILSEAAATFSSAAAAIKSAAAKFSSAATTLSSTVITFSATAEASVTADTQIGAAAGSTGVANAPQGGNLGTDLAALQAAYQSLSFDLFTQQESTLRKLVQTATEYVGKLQQWVSENQTLTQTLGLIGMVVIGVAGAIGTVASAIAPVFTGISTLISLATTFGGIFTSVGGTIMTVLGGLTLPIVGIIAAVAAAAAAVYFFWEPISAFFSGVIEGIKAAFAPIAELFTPFQPVFDTIGQAISRVASLFSELTGPIKFSQETLESCGNAGQIFGQALVTAFTMPLQTLKWLREGIDWVLEKLGIINKQPAIEIPKPQAEAAAGGAVFGAIQPGNVSNYQAVKPASGGSYVDQSKTDINITLQGDVSPGSDNSRHIQELLRKQEEDKRTRALSHFNFAGGFAS